jgi:hypothetical protein
MRGFITCKLYQILLGCDKVKEDEIGGDVARMGEVRNA